MLERASGQFTIDGIVEDIFGGLSGVARIARISQTCRFAGALEGESIGEYTAVLPRDGGGSFQGFQRISGALGEREGSFVISVSGDYAKGLPRGTWSIVPKSGSGDFLHIRGGGSFAQSAGKPGSYKLEFDLRKPRKSRDATESEANELVPGIDIAPEDEIAMEANAVVAQPVSDLANEKPVRRKRPTAAATETAAAEPASTPKRSRKKAESVAVEPAPAPAEIELAPTRKRSRTKQAEITSELAPPLPEKAPRSRTRKRATPVIEQAAPEAAAPQKRSRKVKSPDVAAEAVPVAEPAPRRRRTREQPQAEDIASTPAPAAEKPRKRGRKAAVIADTEPVVAESAPPAEPKPSRRKKPVSPPKTPLQLPVAQEKSARQRKAKAA